VKKRTLVAVALAVIFTLALAAPVFAQDMTHSVDYDLDGTISLKKHVGHLCNTGAEMKQTIVGAGSMTKSTDAYMMAGYLTVDDDNDWIASATSTLAVITAIELCAPAKYVDEDGNVVFPYHGLEDTDEALTLQIWAAHVKADPGYSGNMHTDFAAAYGPMQEGGHINSDNDDEVDDDKFAFDDALGKVVVGKDYVGNYFNMDAWFRTSMGATQRFVSLSSPWSHAYLTEDITVVGSSEIKEALELMNLPEGQEATTDWWDLF